MKLIDILEAFEEYAPFSLQESYDNSGIQIGNPQNEVTKGLVCVDITEAVMEEATEKGCDLIISHHPLIFGGLKSITGKNSMERIVVTAIQKNISILSVHTNLDSVIRGVNQKFAQRIGLVDLKILQGRNALLRKLVCFCPEAEASKVRDAIFKAGAGQIGDYDCCSYNTKGEGTFRAGDKANPFVGEKGDLHQEPEIRIETILPDYLQKKIVNAMIEAHPYEEVAYDIYPLENSFDQVGMGMLGLLPKSLSEKDFLQMLKDELGVPTLRHSGFLSKPVNKVAICGGSGSFLRHQAIASGADAFVTADLKYHDFFDAENHILMVDVGHYESEQFTKEILYEIVSKKITNFALLISDQSTNPVRYF